MKQSISSSFERNANMTPILNRLITHQLPLVQKCLGGTRLFSDLSKPISYAEPYGRKGHGGRAFYRELPSVKVVNGDTVDVARSLHPIHFGKIAILNMANSRSPAGGQEGMLFRQLALSLVLEDAGGLRSSVVNDAKLYPIPERGAIYSASVPEIRKSAWNDHEELGPNSKPKVFNVISAAAKPIHDYCFQEHEDHFELYSKIYQEMTQRIRVLFRVGALMACDTLVLGAYGCGIFGNNPSTISNIFFKVMQETEFLGRFKAIVFAVTDGKGRPSANNTIFKKTFDIPMFKNSLYDTIPSDPYNPLTTSSTSKNINRKRKNCIDDNNNNNNNNKINDSIKNNEVGASSVSVSIIDQVDISSNKNHDYNNDDDGDQHENKKQKNANSSNGRSAIPSPYFKDLLVMDMKNFISDSKRNLSLKKDRDVYRKRCEKRFPKSLWKNTILPIIQVETGI